MDKKQIAESIMKRYKRGDTDFGATQLNDKMATTITMYRAGKCTPTGSFKISSKYGFDVADALIGNAQDAIKLAKLVLEESEGE